jgi:hypothetical protein
MRRPGVRRSPAEADMRRTGRAFALLIALVAAPLQALPDFSQEVKAGGITFLRDSDDPHAYHALPSHARLATDAGGRARFSFLSFSFRGEDGGEGPSGALLNFLLVWGLDAVNAEAAQNTLRMRDASAVIRGAVPVLSGSWRVVVSGPRGRWVLAEGDAPKQPGSQVAFSRRLDPDTAKRLETDLADASTRVAVGFLLVCEGVGPPVEARVVYDWDRIEARSDLRALHASGASFAVPEAEVRAAFDALRADGSIAVDGAQAGAPAAQDAAFRGFREALFEASFGATPGSDDASALEARFARRAERRRGRVEVSLSKRSREERIAVATSDITDAVRDSLKAGS